jgi:hypothetical protein
MWDIESADQLADNINQIVQFLRHSTKDRIATFVALAASSLATWLALAGRPTQLGFIDEATWQKISSDGSFGLYLLSGLLIVWIVVRIWRRLTPQRWLASSRQRFGSAKWIPCRLGSSCAVAGVSRREGVARPE